MYLKTDSSIPKNGQKSVSTSFLVRVAPENWSKYTTFVLIMDKYRPRSPHKKIISSRKRKKNMEVIPFCNLNDRQKQKKIKRLKHEEKEEYKRREQLYIKRKEVEYSTKKSA